MRQVYEIVNSFSLYPRNCVFNSSSGISSQSNRARSSKAGDYTKLDGTIVNSRFVYRSQDGLSYLYFWAPHADWLVGPDYNSSAAWLTTVDDTNKICPETASDWEYRNNDDDDDDAWYDGGVSIACFSAPPCCDTVTITLTSSASLAAQSCLPDLREMFAFYS